MNIGKRHENMLLVTCVLTLVLIGIIMIYSATNVMAGSSAKFGRDAAWFLKKQILFLALGIATWMVLARVDYDWYRKRMPWLMAGGFACLLMVYVPGLRHTANGASRWINLRVCLFQPSELAKFLMIAYAAWAIDRTATTARADLATMKPYLKMVVVLVLFVLPILKEPDLGMTVVICLSFMTILFIAGLPLKMLGALVPVSIAAVVWLVTHEAYRMKRLTAFLDPFSQASGAGYQVVQSLIAFSNGGLLGSGVGGGKQKLFYLPEMHTDYIFSVVGEELGFVGVAAVGACFLVLVWVGFRIARRARDPFGEYLAMGLSIVIGLQAFMNMMVGLSLLPPKGMVLPFLSFGGSSLVLHMAAAGILINISMKGAEGIVQEDDHRRGRDRRPCLSGDSAC
ncbi:MAG TPA: putative lipid II flippase FtsW [Candidatus Deferrimicrobiaceae bacterium]|jgi:cell division protein FtsW